jgi:hypothetical protein
MITRHFAQHRCSESALSSVQPLENLVVLDCAAPSYHTLIVGLFPDAEIALLDPSRDGARQIADILTYYQQVKNLYMVANGEPATLQLGSSCLRTSNLSHYAQSLQAWSNALSADAQILVYGSNVGEGEQGSNFVQRLSELTGARITAFTEMMFTEINGVALV